MFQPLLSVHLVSILKWKKETTMESRQAYYRYGMWYIQIASKTSKVPEQMNLKLVPNNSSSSSIFTRYSCNIHPQIWNRCWLTQHTFIYFLFIFLELLNLFLVDFRHRIPNYAQPPTQKTWIPQHCGWNVPYLYWKFTYLLEQNAHKYSSWFCITNKLPLSCIFYFKMCPKITNHFGIQFK